MKKIILPLFLLCSLLSFSGILKAEENKLQAMMNYTLFYSPQDGPYIETQLLVNGQSIEYIKNKSGKFQGSIEVLILFRKGEEIINFDKYELFSPEISDTANVDFNFLDVQRYVLENGEYEFEIQISDKNSESRPFISLNPLNINYPEDEIIISGIQLINEYSKTDEEGKLMKAGYEMIPFISNFYAEDQNKLTFYAEIYNSKTVLGDNKKFLISYYIETLETHAKLDGLIKHYKMDVDDVKILFHEFDIINLASGNYNLVIEMKDSQNKLVGKNTIFFQRNNPRIFLSEEDFAKIITKNTFTDKITDLDLIRDNIKSLDAISTPIEQSFIYAHVETADLNTLQKFLYDFWYKRDPLKAEEAWDNYAIEVNKVNAAYSTDIRKGYETDRGRAYLKYGPPNSISESYNEPYSYPFEIWHYYKLFDGQNNKRFVFYSEQLDTNEFFLIHSDATGELANYRWQQILNKRVDPGFNLDDGVSEDTWGGNSSNYWNR